MTEPIEPIRGAAAVPRVEEGRVDERRGKERRKGERRSGGKAQSDKARLPVVAAPAASDQEPIAAAVAFAAQLLGQRGQKRGLKGGPKVLKSARTTYLETEWSGPEDRRTPAGKITKTEA